MEEVLLLLNKTMTFMTTELPKTKQDIVKSNTSFDGYKVQVTSDAEKVRQAFHDSVAAGNLASKAQNDLSKALTATEDLMTEIEGLTEIDLATLESVEKRFEEAKHTIESKITIQIELLDKKLIEQNTTITNYELDLDPLRKEVAAADMIFQTLPRRCLKSQICFENCK